MGHIERFNPAVVRARGFIRKHGLATMNWHDNAAAAREVAALGDPAEAALRRPGPGVIGSAKPRRLAPVSLGRGRSRRSQKPSPVPPASLGSGA